MIEGRRITQISKVEGIIIERVHRVIQFVDYTPAGVLPDGTVRQRDMIRFFSDPGGLRTVLAEDLILST
jgi:hypothetical protein